MKKKAIIALDLKFLIRIAKEAKESLELKAKNEDNLLGYSLIIEKTKLLIEELEENYEEVVDNKDYSW